MASGAWVLASDLKLRPQEARCHQCEEAMFGNVAAKCISHSAASPARLYANSCRHFCRRQNTLIGPWPVIIGLVHDVRLARGTKPHPSARPTGAANINILLAMLECTVHVQGDIAECGVFRGATLVPMAVHLKQVPPHKHLFGFDSFEGFDNSILLDISLGGPPEPYKRVGAWRQISCSTVLSKLHRFRAENVILVNDYNDLPWPGCNKAVNEFLTDEPEKLQLIEIDNCQRFYICKGQ
jgi:hypothetical protein